MLSDIDQYYVSQKEPTKSCLIFLREFISNYNDGITEAWRYQMPFYFINGKRFAYLWVNKKTGIPYIGIVDGKLVDHPDLIQEKRSRMKIFIVDPTKDIPVRKLKSLFKQVLSLYEK